MREAAPAVGTEAEERAQYSRVREQADQDSTVQKLREKMDNAETEAILNSTSQEYYKALFDRMRKLDPNLKVRVDRMEKAMMKRLRQRAE